jgi:hypothetical protein
VVAFDAAGRVSLWDLMRGEERGLGWRILLQLAKRKVRVL